MEEVTKYKGYILKHLGRESIWDSRSCRQVRNTFMVFNPAGEGVAKAWGMAEAKALVNADLKGEL